jgi:hypothetical protein
LLQYISIDLCEASEGEYDSIDEYAYQSAGNPKGSALKKLLCSSGAAKNITMKDRISRFSFRMEVP